MQKDTFTISEQMLPVTEEHSLYVQEWGNKNAKSCFIFLHGGPGSGCSDKHKILFNPHTQRVIFFDQRGSGKSTPHGTLKDNTTADLVNDINTIADQYGMDTFVLVGGSWGSTLALTYAVQFPKKVSALVLRGIFTGTKNEVEFLEAGDFKTFFPDVWDKYTESAPTKHRDNAQEFHIKNILGSDDTAAKKSTYAYGCMEGSLSRLEKTDVIEPYEEFDPSGTCIEVYYTHNLCFLEDNYILNNAKKLTMPVWLVQGRYDMVCPPITAYKLSKEIPNAKLVWTTAGHSGDDAENLKTMQEIIGKL